jgi:tetratricopeptide (TPR) repeat protein
VHSDQLEALVVAQHLVSFARGHYPAAQRLGWDLEQLGKLQEAAACYRRAAELRPDGLRHHESLVRIYGKLGNETAVSAEHARWERVRQGR